MRGRLGCAVVLFVLLFCPGAGWCQSRFAKTQAIDSLLDSIAAVRSFKEVALSPDGKRIAWVEALQEKDGAPTENTAVYVVEAAPKGQSSFSAPRRVSAGNDTKAYAEHDLTWSPDSDQLAFLSDKDKSGQLQVYVARPAEGNTKRLTDVRGFLASPRWSPDGKKLAVLFTENAPRPAGPLQPATPDAGVVEEQVYEQRLNVIDMESGRIEPVSPPDLYVYEYDWSGDGKTFVAIAAHGSGDNNWYIAELYTLRLGSGIMKSIYKPALQIAVPRWSPDGKTIAFIGGLMSDEGVIGGDFFTIPAGGGEPQNLTPGVKASASWISWMPTGGQILFTEHIDGQSGIALLDIGPRRLTTVWTGAETITAAGWTFSLSLSADRQTSALIRHSFCQPPEVWSGPIGAWQQITRANHSQRPSWGTAKSIHWKSDAFQVQGWLLYPRDYQPQRRYPMIVSVHGGPASARRPTWPGASLDLALLSSEEYFVFFPNPRGSYGQGEAFTRANVKDFGYGDLRDILAGVDEVVKSYPIDPGRLGIAGWSYGGYMTMWAVTQTHRFRTAVAGAGIANWQSYYGENGIDKWMIPYFGASVYDDPAVYAKSSPITFIKNVRTPTLILVGDRDLECPAPQSYEFWHALKTLGVPNQFVIYPSEGHQIVKPDHRRDIMRRTVAWFDKYLQTEQ